MECEWHYASMNFVKKKWKNCFLEMNTAKQNKNNHSKLSNSKEKNLFWSLSGGKQVKGYVSVCFVASTFPLYTDSIQKTFSRYGVGNWKIKQNSFQMWMSYSDCKYGGAYMQCVCVCGASANFDKETRNTNTIIIDNEMFDLMLRNGVSFVHLLRL